MAAIAVGERKNGGALIVVRIVLPSGFDPREFSLAYGGPHREGEEP
jgi:hypothetical protein